jgi:hypothetical protein
MVTLHGCEEIASPPNPERSSFIVRVGDRLAAVLLGDGVPEPTLTVIRLASAAWLLLASACGGESVGHTPICEATWREIAIPETFALPPAETKAVWINDRLFVLRATGEHVGYPWSVIEYQFPDQFAFAGDGNTPLISPLSALSVAGELTLVSGLNEGGDFAVRYDVSRADWYALPTVDTGGVGWTDVAVDMGGELFLSQRHLETETALPTFFGIAPPWESWRGLAEGSSVPPTLAVWSGSEVIALSSEPSGGGRASSTGGRYDPETDAWAALSELGAPPVRYGATLVWAGEEAIVWGGVDEQGAPVAGARYSPDTNTWDGVTTSGAPAARESHSATAAADRKMIVWGGRGADGWLVDGGVYDAELDRWSALPSSCGPERAAGSSLSWVGGGLVVWGGVPESCADEEAEQCREARERAWYLPAAAAFGEARDPSECACPEPLGQP